MDKNDRKKKYSSRDKMWTDHLYDIDFIGVFPLHSSYFSPDTVTKRKPVSPRRYRVCSFTTMVELDQRVIIPTSGLLTILTLPSNETRAPKAVDWWLLRSKVGWHWPRCLRDDTEIYRAGESHSRVLSRDDPPSRGAASTKGFVGWESREEFCHVTTLSHVALQNTKSVGVCWRRGVTVVTVSFATD